MQEREEEDSKLDARKRKRLERDPLHLGIIVERANLKPRAREIDLAAKLNKSQLQSAYMPANQHGGYYCDVCDCTMKDSLAFLDHINGTYHNRALGMKMEVEKSTLDQVRKGIELAKKKKKGLAVPNERSDLTLLTDGKSLKKSSGSDRDEKSTSEDDNDDMAKIMGFGKFQ